LNLPTFQIEQQYWKKNQLVIGLDEAGRGCLAGPVFAAAVSFPANFNLENSISNYIDNYFERNEIVQDSREFKLFSKIKNSPSILINDSKLLDKNTREVAYNFIIQNAQSYSISQVDSVIIDEINILQASQLAFHKSLDELNPTNEHLLIDGNYFNKFKDFGHSTIIKGDSKSISIAAASILAKVSRDNYMRTIAHVYYPQFGFDKHVGYATKEHFVSLENFGVTEFHRQSFLKKYFERKNNPIQEPLF
jgi:ribonuclease HII